MLVENTQCCGECTTSNSKERRNGKYYRRVTLRHYLAGSSDPASWLVERNSRKRVLDVTAMLEAVFEAVDAGGRGLPAESRGRWLRWT